MDYKVFISYNTKNISLVEKLSKSLKSIGLKPYVADYDFKSGERLSEKIEKNINDSQAVIALLTNQISQNVNQEIGYAKKAGKIIIPIVEKNVEVGLFLKDMEYISFDRDNPSKAIEKVVLRLAQLHEELAQLHKEKKTSDKFVFTILVFLAVFLAVIIFLNLINEKK